MALLAIAIGAGLGALAATRPWLEVRAGTARQSLDGGKVTSGLALALALLALLGVLLLLTLRGVGRWVLSALLAVIGLGSVLVAVLRREPSRATLQALVDQVALTDGWTTAWTPWPWISMVAGLLVVLGAVLALATLRHWPRRPDRYQRAPRPGSDDPWRALDAGEDPTDDATQDPITHTSNERTE